MNILESSETKVDVPVKPPTFGASVRQQLARAQRLEMRIVSGQRHLSDRGLLRALAAASNWLGNGWLYLFLAGALLWAASPRAYGVLLVAGLGVGAAHAVYPWIKRRIARLRPFERAPHLGPRTPVLDRYSFPSGHCMTSCAVGVPFAQGYPEFAWLALTVCLVIAWARVACAHHYPTDLLAGSTLGCLTAYASSALVQTFWTL